jgi:hypothetical protein
MITTTDFIYDLMQDLVSYGLTIYKDGIYFIERFQIFYKLDKFIKDDSKNYDYIKEELSSRYNVKFEYDTMNNLYLFIYRNAVFKLVE